MMIMPTSPPMDPPPRSSHFGLQELVRLPVAPLSEDMRPGLALLIENYTGRMDTTINGWAANILAQDMAVRGAPGLPATGAGWDERYGTKQPRTRGASVLLCRSCGAPQVMMPPASYSRSPSALTRPPFHPNGQGAPHQMADGTLRTPGAVDFFRILNENVRGRDASQGAANERRR